MTTPTPPIPAPVAPRNGMASAGLALGITGILLCWLPLVGLVAGILGIVFGAIGMSKAGRLGGVGRGAATGGLVCGIVSVVLLPVMAAIAIPAFLDYMHKGKRTPSARDLTMIERKIKAYYIERAELPPSASVMPDEPGGACNSATGRIPKQPQSAWEAAGWGAIGFHLDEGSLHSYRWVRDPGGQRGHLEALADLDCDGVVSTLRVEIEQIDGDVSAIYGSPTAD
jgi:hypothetical protein